MYELYRNSDQKSFLLPLVLRKLDATAKSYITFTKEVNFQS